jgi:hypothetical protein
MIQLAAVDAYDCAESQGEATGVSWRLGARRPGIRRSANEPSAILYGCAAATAWSREKFIALDGFDP